jgi:hypothetical protein
MIAYEYKLINLELIYTDSEEFESALNYYGEEGFRYVEIKKFITVTNNIPEENEFILFEKAYEKED